MSTINHPGDDFNTFAGNNNLTQYFSAENFSAGIICHSFLNRFMQGGVYANTPLRSVKRFSDILSAFHTKAILACRPLNFSPAGANAQIVPRIPAE